MINGSFIRSHSGFPERGPGNLTFLPPARTLWPLVATAIQNYPAMDPGLWPNGVLGKGPLEKEGGKGAQAPWFPERNQACRIPFTR